MWQWLNSTIVQKIIKIKIKKTSITFTDVCNSVPVKLCVLNQIMSFSLQALARGDKNHEDDVIKTKRENIVQWWGPRGSLLIPSSLAGSCRTCLVLSRDMVERGEQLMGAGGLTHSYQGFHRLPGGRLSRVVRCREKLVRHLLLTVSAPTESSSHTGAL